MENGTILAQLHPLIDDAMVHGRRSLVIDAVLWDLCLPVARSMCGVAFRQMYAPWRAFMYDGVWIEKGTLSGKGSHLAGVWYPPSSEKVVAW